MLEDQQKKPGQTKDEEAKPKGDQQDDVRELTTGRQVKSSDTTKR